MIASRRTQPYFAGLFGLLAILGLFGKDEPEIRYVDEYISFTQIAKLALRDLPKREAWQKAAPKIMEISIPRDGSEPEQPALWYHSGTDHKKPLLLVLHSWSADYRQHYGIPYGVFAEHNDWVFIHPDYRGEFDDEDATGSEKAVADVLDALDYAKSHAPVDEDRIYLAGFSGGAMMSLLMIARYPEKFSAAVVWVPVYDLNDWYDTLVRSEHYYANHYVSDIEASCGGKPDTDARAEASCKKRSPSNYLSNARGKGVHVFISGGIHDHFVPPSHAVRAFNDLAEEEDRIAEADGRYLDEKESLPEALRNQRKSNRFFEQAGLPIAFARSSQDATILLFDGGHDVVYNAGLEWLAKLHP